MLFAKGEIIMNNIYKVIWSKAKNCYVVASEIARSHTKSATGSGKIGGVTRRSLLASLMALSLLCGGLGVASAANGTVHVAESSASSDPAVYTTEKVDTLLKDKADKTALDTKANETEVVKNTEDIAANKGNITNLENNKADKTYVDMEVGKKANKATTLAGYDIGDAYTKAEVDTAVENKLVNYATKTEVVDKIAAEAIARDTAINTAITLEKDARRTAIDTAINGEVSARNQAINTAITQEVTARDLAVTNAKTELQGKITAEETERKEADTAFNNRLTTAEGKIGDNTTAIDALKAKDTVLEGQINTLDGRGVKYDDAAVKDTITLAGLDGTKITRLKDATLSDSSTDAVTGKQLNQTNENLAAETAARENKDNELDGRVATAEGNINNLKAKDIVLEGNIQTNRDNIAATNKRTAGIDRIEATSETTIEKNVTVDNQGNVTAKGKLEGEVVDAGAVNAGSLVVENASTLKGNVTMNQKLNVTGDTSLGKTDVGGALTVTGASDLKGNVTLGTTAANTVTVNGTANFNAPVNMANGLNVTNGETKLRDTTVTGDLNVTGTITTDTMVFGVKPTNYTEIDQGKVTSKNSYINGAGQSITSSSTFDVEKNEVGFVNNATGDQSYHKQTAKGINGSVTDKAGNTTYTKVTATENSFQVQDKDGKNTNHQVNTKDSSVTEITDKNGATTTKTEQTAKDITNTAEQGTITNKAQTIVNNATGDMTNTVGGKLTTTVTGQATENFNNGLNTTVTGTENHTVNGKQINTVTKGQGNIISGGQTNTITGGQINNITGDQTTTVTDGNISNTAKNITNEANEMLTDKVGTNTRVTTSTSITDTVGTTTNRKIEDGKITDTAGDSTVVTENEKGTTFTKTGSTAFSTAADAPMDTNIAGNHITTGRVDANELGVSDKDGDNSAGLSVKAGEGVKASASNGTITGSLDVTADEVGSSVKDASGKGSTFKQRIDAIMMESKNVSITAEGTLTKEAKDIVTNASNSITEKVGDTNVTEKTTTSSKSEIQNADTITSVQQTENMVQSYVGKKDLSATNVTTNFANASANQVTENGQTSTVLNNKDGLLIQNNANGNSFTTADGTNTGPALEWTNIKGNEISTGKVEANYVKMGYADVMKDLGVRGNAKVGQNLEVGGTSTLKGDVTMGSNATVKNNLNVEGITTTKTLSVTENATVGGTLDVTGKATFKDSVDITNDLTVGGNATIKGDVTAKSYKVGDKTYISADGINANDQKITNVADGSISEGSKDAVNGGQLYGMKTDLEHKVDKVGANAAAMANLHPMEFDPDSKWNIAAAMGNYGSETATAIGAFYRPNEDVMVNFSTAFGTGENMVGGGVSVRLGKGGNKLSREETNALKAQVNDLTARMDALLSVLNPNMSKDFPDVPENHWAYEAVSRLAGNDIVQGYPDGEFHGDRTMTRYEMAEIIYNALSRGAEAEKELVEEFKPELQAMAASEKATAERAEG